MNSATRDLKLNVTSDPANLAPVRQAFEQFATECGFGATAVGEIGLVVNEALANVTRHAYAGANDRPIAVEGHFEGDTMTIRVRDWGTGVNPLAVAKPRVDPTQPGGLGLICMRSLMDDVSYTPQPDGMLLTLSKRR